MPSAKPPPEKQSSTPAWPPAWSGSCTAPAATRPNVFHELSDREMEVLKLIADGCNNAEIAGKLYLSEKTVKSHVSNILGKLHLADRTQAAVYAWREGVVRRD